MNDVDTIDGVVKRAKRRKQSAQFRAEVLKACRQPDASAVAIARLAIEAINMRAGTETALARVVKVFGAAHPHHACLFANRRANRMKILVHDGIGIGLCARRLHQSWFLWANAAWTTQKRGGSVDLLAAAPIGLKSDAVTFSCNQLQSR
jgi:transposase